LCLALAESVGAKEGYPCCLYQDGHDSHFDSESIQFLHDNHIYVNWLRSNNSSNYQPLLDLGTNSMVKSLYDPGVPLNKSYFNSIISHTWNQFKNVATLSSKYYYQEHFRQSWFASYAFTTKSD
jgi:hypothetical protein